MIILSLSAMPGDSGRVVILTTSVLKVVDLLPGDETFLKIDDIKMSLYGLLDVSGAPWGPAIVQGPGHCRASRSEAQSPGRRVASWRMNAIKFITFKYYAVK